MTTTFKTQTKVFEAGQVLLSEARAEVLEMITGTTGWRVQTVLAVAIDHMLADPVRALEIAAAAEVDAGKAGGRMVIAERMARGELQYVSKVGYVESPKDGGSSIRSGS
jgi:hypothetical protein